MISLPCPLKNIIQIHSLYLYVLLICVTVHMVLHPMTFEILCQSPMFEFGLCPFTSFMLTYV